MSSTRSAVLPGIRLLFRCVVLAGLFCMHVLPAQGCPGGSGMSAGMTPPSASPVSPMTGSPGATTHVDPASPGLAALQVQPATGGAVCLARPPDRDGTAGLICLLMLVVVAVCAPTRSLRRIRRGATWRAPPLRGAALLTALCVSRT